MEKKEKNSRKIDDGKLVVGDDGVQYFVIQKTRIIVTEHFSANPKTIEDRIEELIIYASNAVTADN